MCLEGDEGAQGLALLQIAAQARFGAAVEDEGLAGALEASYFVLIPDVPGVLDADGKLLPKLSRADIDKLKADGVIYGGMIPKVDACLHALAAGAGQALILDGRAESSLGRYLEQGEPLGTCITL